jgi:hypothetical protein
VLGVVRSRVERGDMLADALAEQRRFFSTHVRGDGPCRRTLRRSGRRLRAPCRDA